MKKTLYALICVFALSVILSLGASASIRTEIDLNAKCDLNVVYSADEKGFEALDIAIFRVGDISAVGEYSLSNDFDKYQVDVANVKTQDEWKNIANTLAAYVIADSVEPTARAKTDINGNASFGELSVGLYLVNGLSVERDGEIFTFENFFVSLPGADDEGYPKYDMTAYPKHSSYIPEPEKIEHRVIKLWKDGGNKLRPEKVDIDIFKNGVLESSVELSSENGWAYSWTSDDDGSVWTVVERNIAKDYTVEIVKNEYVFTVTNTYVAPPVVPETGDTSSTWVYVMLMFLAGGVLMILAVKFRKVEM